MKNLRKIIATFFTVILLIGFAGCSKSEETDKIKIVAVNFPAYDFANNVGLDNVSVSMLIKPGSETHSYDPTTKDIIEIQNADIFIYTGGESDDWVTDVLETIDNDDLIVIKMMDIVETYEEEIVEGMETEEDDEDHDHDEEEVEYDEHVWTSPANAIKIIEYITQEIIKIDNDNEAIYTENSNNYIGQIKDVQTEIKDVVENATRTELIFGDRFPFRYLVEEFGLTYYAAFPGCSSDTEASAKTIAFLIDKVNEDNIPVILKIELSSGNIAETISEETGAKVLELHSAHNISADDFNNGVTYVDILKRNVETLKEALN